MTLMDGIIVIGIFAAFGFMILSHMRKKNPNLLDGIKNWFGGKPPIIKEEGKEKMQQIYPEKRLGM